MDATFTDDLPGVPAEHPEVQPATHLSNASLAALQRATQESEMSLASALAISGKFCWDCIGGEDGHTTFIAQYIGCPPHFPSYDSASVTRCFIPYQYRNMVRMLFKRSELSQILGSRPAGSSYSMNQQPPPNNTAGCITWFRDYCKPEMQGRGMLMGWPAEPAAPTEVSAPTCNLFLVPGRLQNIWLFVFI